MLILSAVSTPRASTCGCPARFISRCVSSKTLRGVVRSTATRARPTRLLHRDAGRADQDLLPRLPGLRAAALELLEGSHALDDLAEDRVLAVEPRRRDEGEEELTSVGVRLARVGHREHAGLVVLELRVDLAA